MSIKRYTIDSKCKVSCCLSNLGNTWNFFRRCEDESTQLSCQGSLKIFKGYSGTNMVTKCCKGKCFNDTTIFDSWCRCDFMVSLDGFKLSKVRLDKIEVNFLCQSLTRNVVNIFTSSFEFWRKNLTAICSCYPKSNQGWWYCQFFKGTRHRVFTTDRWQTKLNLSFDWSKESWYWLTKTLCLFIHTLEIFLIRETSLRPVCTSSNQTSCGFDDRISSAMIWRPFCYIRVESLRHNRSSCCHAMLDWQFLYRSFRWCDLVATTKWVIDCWTTNRAIKDSL